MNKDIVLQLIKDNKLKKCHAFIIDLYTSIPFKVKIVDVIYNKSDVILKLKTYKDYPLGHKYIFRSIDEIN